MVLLFTPLTIHRGSKFPRGVYRNGKRLGVRSSACRRVSPLMSPRGRPTLSSESPYADVDMTRLFEVVSCCLTMTVGGLRERVLAETLNWLAQRGGQGEGRANS